MKRYDPKRADARPIEEKAFGLIFAMSEEEASALLKRLESMVSKHNSKRAKMFVGYIE